jgi:CheY-like chemotaxis protein
MQGVIDIAICFSEPEHSEAIGLQLKKISSKVNLHISSNFEEFLIMLSNSPKMDCFVIEMEFKECSSLEFIEKLKESIKFKNSGIVLFTPDKTKLDGNFDQSKIDYIFDHSTGISQLINNVTNIIGPQITPVIPADYRVLVLEDQSEVLEVIAGYLKELKHEKFDLCRSVNEALNLLTQNDYDLLLLDWNLEDGTCTEVMDAIKESDKISMRTKSALVVVVTGRNDVDDIMSLLKYGVNDSIIKPFDFKEFEDKLVYAVDKHLSTR